MTARIRLRQSPSALIATSLGCALPGLSGRAQQKFAAAHYLCRTEKYRTLSAANPDSLSAEDIAYLVRHKKQCYDYRIQIAELKRNPPKPDDSDFYIMTGIGIFLTTSILVWGFATTHSHSD